MSEHKSDSEAPTDAQLIAFLRARSGEGSAMSVEGDPALAPAEDLWNALDDLRDDSVIRAMRSAALGRLAANDAAADCDEDDAEAPISKPPARRKWLALAACLVLVSAVGFQVLTARAPHPSQSRVALLENGQAAPHQFRLADGSQVTLDVGSQVEVASLGDVRRLTLRKGRAFFDVAHDPAHPFVVSVGSRSVTALGTRFAVSDRTGDPLVLLKQGRVRVAEEGGPQRTELAPNQQLSLGRNGHFAVSTADAGAASEWTTGQLTFGSEKVSRVLERLNPYLKRPLHLTNPDDASIEISGTFQLGDAPAFEEALRAMGVEVTQSKAR